MLKTTSDFPRVISPRTFEKKNNFSNTFFVPGSPGAVALASSRRELQRLPPKDIQKHNQLTVPHILLLNKNRLCGIDNILYLKDLKQKGRYLDPDPK